MATIKALLFDLDGTLIHSMPLHEHAWTVFLQDQKLEIDRQSFFERTTGRTNAEIFDVLLPDQPKAEHERLALRKEEIYRDLARTQLKEVPGAVAFVKRMHAQGLKIAVCTAAPLANIECAFELFDFKPMLSTLTCPAQGLRGKPHPDLYAEAARRMNIEPAACLVFEDAPLGVEAGLNAGMPAVALTTTVGPQAFATHRNLVAHVTNYLELNSAGLLEQAAALKL
jgi:beta-phosphoglucomutase